MPNIIIGKDGVFQNGFFNSEGIDDLVVSLDSDDSSSWPGSGTTWFDLQNNVDFTLNGVDTGTDSEFMRFDDSGEYAEAQNVSLFDKTKGTWEAWVNLDFALDGSGTGEHVLTFWGLDVQNGMFISFDDRTSSNTSFSGSISFSMRDNEGFTTQSEARTPNNLGLNSGTFHHIVATWDTSSDDSKIYVNNNLEGSGNTKNISASLPDFNIGNTIISPNTFPIDGVVEIFRIYNRQLTASEVSQSYNDDIGRF